MTDKKVGDLIQTTLTGDDGKDHAVSFRIAGIGDMKQVSRWLKINDGQYIRLFVRESLVKWANRRLSQAFSTVISFDAGKEAETVLSQIESAKHLQLVDSGSLESGSFLEMVAKMIRTLMLLFLLFSSLICFLNVYNSVCTEKAECDAAVSGHDEEGDAPAGAEGVFRTDPRGISGVAAGLSCFVSGFRKGDYGGIWQILDSGSVWYDWPDDTCDSGCPLYCSRQMQEGSRIRHH